MLEFKINGETYTEKEFQRDLRRYFVTSLKSCSPCDLYGNCKRCMFFKHELCGEHFINAKPIKNSFDIVEKVYNWAKEHPVVTNRDKMIETFGGDYFNLIINYISDRSLEDYDIWLNEEYKKPGKDKQNG